MSRHVPIDFLAVGHITHDRASGGFRLGGTATFAAVTASRLGWHPAVMTRGSHEGLDGDRIADGPADVVLPAAGPLAGIPVCRQPSAASTTFINVYHHGQRTQIVEALAEPISPEALPASWAAVRTVLLGPIAREVPEHWLALFPDALIGVTPQGWMRKWDRNGHVHPCRWENADRFLARADAVVFSREDVGGDESYIAGLARRGKVLVVTDGWHGARLYLDGRDHQIAARTTAEVDPTGAGDVFATAFLLRLAEAGDPLVAARFASVAASMSVEAPGTDAIPSRDQVDAWLEENP